MKTECCKPIDTTVSSRLGYALWLAALMFVICSSSELKAQTSSETQNCQIELAPKSFVTKSGRKNSKGLPVNHGIIPKGFVAYQDKSPVVHGVDVSKWQSHADFKRIQACGGRFAYVRLSAGTFPDNELEYRVHWANARGVGLLPGPYHFLTVPALNAEASDDKSANDKLMAESLASATQQAELFMARLHEVLSLEPAEQGASRSKTFLPIVLAVASVSPRVRNQSEAAYYAKFYTAAACQWLETVRRSLPSSSQNSLMLFTYPYIYKDYGFDRAPCSMGDIPIWLANFPLDGGRFSTDPTQRQIEQEICLRGGSNRCRFQLYSSYGVFAQFDGNAALDLDRYHGTEQDLAKLLQTLPR